MRRKVLGKGRWLCCIYLSPMKAAPPDAPWFLSLFVTHICYVFHNYT